MLLIMAMNMNLNSLALIEQFELVKKGKYFTYFLLSLRRLYNSWQYYVYVIIILHIQRVLNLSDY